jgi:hypothetical protein
MHHSASLRRPAAAHLAQAPAPAQVCLPHRVRQLSQVPAVVGGSEWVQAQHPCHLLSVCTTPGESLQASASVARQPSQACGACLWLLEWLLPCSCVCSCPSSQLQVAVSGLCLPPVWSLGSPAPLLVPVFTGFLGGLRPAQLCIVPVPSLVCAACAALRPSVPSVCRRSVAGAGTVARAA